MKNYIIHDEWKIIEKGFNPELNRISESLFSLGNGRMGHRANFEERYGGDSLQGSYIAGVYYPDKTRVGWWKNGYPDYFAKVLNAANWIGIDITVNGVALDLATCDVHDFQRVLNMKEGYLLRTFRVTLPSGKRIRVQSKRFCSIVDDEIGAIAYSVTAENFSSGFIAFRPYLDINVENEDANYDEKFWNPIESTASEGEGYIIGETKKTKFHVCTGMKYLLKKGDKTLAIRPNVQEAEKFVANTVFVPINREETVTIYKYAANVSSMNYEKAALMDACKAAVNRAFEKGFTALLQEQADAWAAKWAEADIMIEGDVAGQQGIRFCIFQMYQTYTGEDERLNIGPKGFTGEKYGGSTYWDTEAYCFPFYLATAEPKVARQLLIYRYKHLPKAIENAEKLGFTDGAALYPMVTINGEECHNEWEITFEEVHRNGAIAYAIHDYIRYTGDKNYLIDYGVEVLIGIARFWAQRVHFSPRKKQYVMHGVTGPNEYENNVNNNWYTSYIALWCMEYAAMAVDYVKAKSPKTYETLVNKINFKETSELAKWNDIRQNMYLPYDEEWGIFLQQENYFDKEDLTTADLKPSDRPINQNWSWDRILRSPFIKQADVLQGLYFFEERFDEATIRKNFDFYEPKTVHESSLSPCVHVVLASKLGKEEKAYEMYLRTARLDLDDYNNDSEDGLHITSMAGTWMAFVKGFGGMRVYDDTLQFNPYLPKNWTAYSFNIRFRGHIINVKATQDKVTIANICEAPITLIVRGVTHTIGGNKILELKL